MTTDRSKVQWPTAMPILMALTVVVLDETTIIIIIEEVHVEEVGIKGEEGGLTVVATVII